ncbi:MAG: hypothetical protein WDN06_13305 [Asticcacaulis sp.]
MVVARPDEAAALRPAHRIDWLGFVVMAAASATLLLGINTRGDDIMGVPRWTAFALSGVFLGAVRPCACVFRARR